MKKIIYASMILTTLCFSLMLTGCNNAGDDIDSIEIDIDAELEGMDRSDTNYTLDDLNDITKGIYLYFISENSCPHYNKGADILSGDESKAEEEKTAFINYMHRYQKVVSDYLSEDDEAYEIMILMLSLKGEGESATKPLFKYMVIAGNNNRYLDEFHRRVRESSNYKECKKLLDLIKEGYMN